MRLLCSKRKQTINPLILYKMKNYKILLSVLLTLVAMLTFSCDKEPEDSKDPNYMNTEVFDLTQISSDSKSLQVGVTLKTDSDPGFYIVGVATKEQFMGEFTSDDSKLADYIVKYALAKGVSLVDPGNNYIFRGNAHVHLSGTWSIAPATDYIIAAFLVSKDGELKSMVSKIEVKTDEINVSEGPFEVSIENTEFNDIVLNITPKDPESNYFVGLTTQNAVDTTPIEDIAEGLIANWITYGIDFSKVDNRYVYKGNNQVSMKHWLLAPNTNYVVYVFTIGSAGEILSEIQAIGAKTDEVLEAPIELSVLEVTQDEIKLNVVPQSEVGNYFVYGTTKDDIEAGYSGDTYAFAANILIFLKQFGRDFSSPDNELIYNGENKVSMTTVLRGPLMPGAEYVIIACGVDANGTITTPVASLYQNTAEPEMSDMKLEISSHFPGPSSTMLRVKPSNDEESFIFQPLTDAQIESMTEEEIINFLLDSGSGYSGIQIGTFGNLSPETHYTVYAFGFAGRTKTTEIFKYQFSTVRDEIEIPEDITFTTEPFGNITIKIIDDQTPSKLDVAPNDKENPYFFQVIDKDTYNTFPTDEAIVKAAYAEIRLAASQVENGSNVTEFSKRCLVGEVTSMNFMSFPPGTSFIAYAFTVDQTTLMPTTEMKKVEIVSPGYSTKAEVEEFARKYLSGEPLPIHTKFVVSEI